MSGDTAIEWTDATWNPTTGCDKVSPGCDHCYAMTLAKRLKGMGSAAYQLDGPAATSGPGFLAHEWPRALDWPLHKTKPLLIFVNSMSDLFHANISDEYIAQVWAVMSLAPQQTFQILTKRHARMRGLVRSATFRLMVNAHRMRRGYSVLPDSRQPDGSYAWPLPNVWLGVSAESQHWADIRIPALLDTPAAVRFISAEPLLGPIDLSPWLRCPDCGQNHGLRWVIAGGESGPGARPMHLDWAQSLRDQCVADGVPFLFKQWGEWAPSGRHATGLNTDAKHEHFGEVVDDGKLTDFTWRRVYRRVGKKAAGRELDGREWNEYPVAQ